MATPAHTGSTWRFGIFEVNAHREELHRTGIPIKIRENSFRILVFLLQHPGEIVTREQLRAVLWPADTFVDFEHGLNTAIDVLQPGLIGQTEELRPALRGWDARADSSQRTGDSSRPELVSGRTQNRLRFQ